MWRQWFMTCNLFPKGMPGDNSDSRYISARNLRVSCFFFMIRSMQTGDTTWLPWFPVSSRPFGGKVKSLTSDDLGWPFSVFRTIQGIFTRWFRWSHPFVTNMDLNEAMFGHRSSEVVDLGWPKMIFDLWPSRKIDRGRSVPKRILRTKRSVLIFRAMPQLD